MSRPPVIAIDGPVAAGKTTVAQMLAKELKFFYLDTGVLYRALTWKALTLKVDPRDEKALAETVKNLSVRISPSTVEGRPDSVWVDGRDVSLELRAPAVDAYVSAVSAHPLVREALVELQRNAVQPPGTVVAGRDIGTVIFPDADLKIYLDANAEERARRRLLQQGGWSESGLVETRRRLEERDRRDATRAVAPLQRAPDALVIDTDDIGPRQVVNRIIEVFDARRGINA
jgi:cytidylate kinase